MFLGGYVSGCFGADSDSGVGGGSGCFLLMQILVFFVDPDDFVDPDLGSGGSGFL